MLWLIWQMGLLLLLAVGLGVLVGYRIWGGAERAAELNSVQEDNARLRRVNENLARRLGERGEDAAPAEAKAPSKARSKSKSPAKSPAKAVANPAAEAPAEPAMVSPSNPVTPEASETDSVGEKPSPKPAAATASGEDGLTRIKGLGPKAEAALKAGGVTSLAQIAAWSESDIETWDARIGGRGRIARDDWVGQAREITAG